MEESKSVSDQTTQDSVESEEIKKQEDVVKYETHMRVLNERKKDLAKRRELEAELEKLRSEQAEREKAVLAEQGKYKELADHYKTELEQTKGTLSEHEQMIQEGIKLQAFKSKVGGEFKNPKYMSFVELDKINLLDDGSIDEGSLEMVVNNFKKEHQDLLKLGNNARLPSDAPVGATNTVKNIKDMSKDELKAALGHNLKTIMSNRKY